MIPPKGFRAEIYPLRHNIQYATGLSLGNTAVNYTIFTLVKNYKTLNAPATIDVNPHHATFKVETGAICQSMSIIDKLKLFMTFNLTEDGISDGHKSVVVNYMPIFTSFPHRLEEVDEKTSTSVAALLELTKDATQEDITPAFDTDMFMGTLGANLPHPVTTANRTEVFGELNLTTDLIMEGIPWDSKTFFQALKYYTNKGALGSCTGKMRSLHLTENRPTARVFINRFVPKDVRRIMPYSYFGMLVGAPVLFDSSQNYETGAVSAGKPAVGVKLVADYHEWHPDFNQEMEG